MDVILYMYYDMSVEGMRTMLLRGEKPSKSFAISTKLSSDDKALREVLEHHKPTYFDKYTTGDAYLAIDGKGNVHLDLSYPIRARQRVEYSAAIDSVEDGLRAMKAMYAVRRLYATGSLEALPQTLERVLELTSDWLGGTMKGVSKNIDSAVRKIIEIVEEGGREEREAKEREKAEMSGWIDRHGSDRLKRVFREGYPCVREYAEERARHEVGAVLPRRYYVPMPAGDDATPIRVYLPPVVDTGRKASFTERISPSDEGLDAVDILRCKGYPDARLVWVNKGVPSQGAEEFVPAEPRECILIDGYLRRFRLYIPINSMPKGTRYAPYEPGGEGVPAA